VTETPLVLAATDPPAVLAVDPQTLLPAGDQTAVQTVASQLPGADAAVTLPAVLDPLLTDSAQTVVSGAPAQVIPSVEQLEADTAMDGMKAQRLDKVLGASGGSTYCAVKAGCPDVKNSGTGKVVKCYLAGSMQYSDPNKRFLATDYERVVACLSPLITMRLHILASSMPCAKKICTICDSSLICPPPRYLQ
jgi:hypothetical protein